MGIVLSPDRQAFLDREVARGGGSADDIANRALRLYETHVESLRAEIAKADSELQHGECVPFDPDQLRARHLALAQARSGHAQD